MDRNANARTRLLEEMITLIPRMEIAVIENFASTPSRTDIRVVDDVAAYFGILPRLSEIRTSEYLKWIQILRFVCHPDKHRRTVSGIRNATRLFTIVDTCFQHHRSRWVEQVQHYIEEHTENHSSDRRYIHSKTQVVHRDTTESIRRFRETVVDADIQDSDSLLILQRREDRHRAITALTDRRPLERVSSAAAASSSSSSAVQIHKQTPMMVRQPQGLSYASYKAACAGLYDRRAYLNTWVSRTRHTLTGVYSYRVHPYTTRVSRLPGRGRITYLVNNNGETIVTMRAPPSSPDSITDLDFAVDGTHVTAFVAYLLSAVEPDCHTFMLSFFEQIRSVALANLDIIDPLVLYTETSAERASAALWKVVGMDPVQYPYMLYMIRKAQTTLQTTRARKRYAYLLMLSDGTEENLATQAMEQGRSLVDLIDASAAVSARLLTNLVQQSSLPVYYTRMLDRVLQVLGREAIFHHLCRIVVNNRAQLEAVMRTSEFDLMDMADPEVESEDVLLIVETLLEEVLPAGHGNIFQEMESIVVR